MLNRKAAAVGRHYLPIYPVDAASFSELIENSILRFKNSHIKIRQIKSPARTAKRLVGFCVPPGPETLYLF